MSVNCAKGVLDSLATGGLDSTGGLDVQSPSGTAYRFGQFEVNAVSGELFKNGRRVKLQEQPFRLLVVFLENPGEIVTREELRSRIWPEDKFVDFDGSLRVAVRKLREGLDDDAESPRYIETIPNLTPDSSPLVLHDTGSQEIYALDVDLP
jgi:DNA-binding response OmpR family regulator